MSCTILVVEDDAHNIILLEAMLEGHGCKIVSCYNASDALSILQTQSIDVIVTDICLPQMNGVEFAEQVRTMPLYTHVPIIAISAVAEPDLIKGMENVGCTAIFSKPLNVRALRGAVQMSLSA